MKEIILEWQNLKKNCLFEMAKFEKIVFSKWQNFIYCDFSWLNLKIVVLKFLNRNCHFEIHVYFIYELKRKVKNIINKKKTIRKYKLGILIFFELFFVNELFNSATPSLYIKFLMR